MRSTILITIDVEDWFQVENFRPWIPFETWDQRELRVEKNVHRFLNLFDSGELIAHSSKLIEKDDPTDSMNSKLSIEARSQEKENKGIKSSDSNYELSAMSYELGHGRPKATFFVLGWLAERLPNLIREIHSRGHEVASHGYNHSLCNQLSDNDLRADLSDSKKKLEDITGSPVRGYRAPNFSISNDILKLVEDCGYHYDSSYNSFALHGRYGKVSLNGSRKKGLAHKIANDFFELPISNLVMKGRVFPLGGGGYFRLMPFQIFKKGVTKILSKENAYLFYLHPWEIDPGQPVVKKASATSKIKHYSNLSKSLNKLIKLINSFPKCQFITCSQYLSKFE